MDGAAPPEEDFNSLPIPDRLSHKNWKARVSAYESLIKTFQTTASDTDPAFKPYISNPDLLKKIATDANAVAQEKGVECLVNLVKYAGETAARTREAVVPALVDKCFGSTRAGTKNQAVELVLQYVEVENGGAGAVEDILPGLNAKQPKVVAGCVTALKEIVRLFGTGATPPAPVLKALPKIFAHSDKTVRSEGTLLAHALYQYIGPGIEQWLTDLKPVQVKELKESWEAMEKEGKGWGSLKPERLTRAAAREAEANAGVADAEEAGDAPQEDLAPPDPRMFAEEVDVVPKLPPTLQASLGSSKWKERKEALDDLLTLLNATPRIKDAPQLGELAKSLATCVQKDANINCVMVAAQCIESLAKGVMSPFGRHKEAVVPPLLERLKERKATVTDTIGAALDAIFTTTTLPDVLPDALPALNSKNPQVKEGTLKFLARCLATSPTALPAPQVKPLSEALASLLEDSFEGARSEAAVCLGTLMKMVGERPLNALMDSLADVRKAKVKEAYESATVKAKAGASAPPKPTAPEATKEPPKKKAAPPKPAQASSSPPGSMPSEEELLAPLENKPVKKPPARLLAKKPAATGSPPAAAAPAAVSAAGAPAKKLPPAAAAAASKSGKAAAPPAPGSLDTFKYKHTPEDAEALAVDLVPPNFATDLADSNWKTRLAALEEMTTWAQGAAGDLDAEVVIRFLAKKGWSEKNFQVSAKLYGILGILAEQCPSFGRSCAALCIPHLSEKLGDTKLKKPAGDTLLLFAEKTSLQFILGHAYEPLSKQKAPKVLADALTWVEQALVEFGIAGLSLRSLIEFLKAALKNSNAAVRTSATKTLVTVKLFAGSSVKDLLEDVNPQLLNTIMGEFDKVEGTPAPQPTRTSADLANMAPAAGASAKGGATTADPLDDLFPRVEIDNLLKGTTILADAKSDAWKTKKEALETLQAILDQGANKRLKPNMGEIGQVLKARVMDSNKAVQSLALDIVSRVATGMGRPFEKYTRLFAQPVATVLSDQKAPIRAAALQTLTSIATACEGVESMVAGITTALESSNPLQKASLLNWIADWFKEHEPTPGLDLTSWAAPIVTSLDDRSGDIRKGAQAILPILIACAGYDYVIQQTSSLKPASRASATPLIQAARGSTPASAAPPSKAAPAAAPAKPAAASKAAPSRAAPPKAAAPVSPPPRDELSPPPTETTKVAAASKVTGVRRRLPQGSVPRPESRSETPVEGAAARLAGKPGIGLKRPGATNVSPAKALTSPGPEAFALPFTSANSNVKKARLAKDAQKWVNEAGATKKDLAELLHHQMEPHASKELSSLLFSHDHNAVNDHVSGLSMMHEFYSSVQAGEDKYGASLEHLQDICIANSDLALKYVSIKVHEPQSNLVQKCLDVVEAVLGFMQSVDYQLTDPEAWCFIPTIAYKLGDAREPVRARVALIVQSLTKVYAFSRVFQILLEHGLKSKVAKARQGTLDELASLLKRFGMGACEPSKSFPIIASMISDKDPQVRKSALAALSEGYVLVGESIWSLVGRLSPKDKTQLEERLRRVPGVSTPDRSEATTQATRLGASMTRSGSPAPGAIPRLGGIPRPNSPAVAPPSRLARPTSPAHTVRSSSPAPSSIGRPTSPSSRLGKSPGPSQLPGRASPSGLARPKTFLPSRLGQPKTRLNGPSATYTSAPAASTSSYELSQHEEPPMRTVNASRASIQEYEEDLQDIEPPPSASSNDITVTISSILSNDPARSVEALKKIQKVLEIGPDNGPSSPEYRDLAEHTEGLIETITLQMAHVFERPQDLTVQENFRLAKHLIQTLNAFCDHTFLAESLTVDILTSLLEELTLRLLQTDNNPDNRIKDLSRFINMIILRLFATGRRMSIFRALFALLLQIVKPFPSNGTPPDSQDAKVAELVLKCVWKLARNIPQDLEKQVLDPVELFPSVEHFLQSIPPNEWRARATNKVPCGDMPLRTIKVIIQHVVAHYGDETYDLLSGSFDDPSATIVYPYVYRILNSSAKTSAEVPMHPNGVARELGAQELSPALGRPVSPQGTSSSVTSEHRRQSSSSHARSQSVSSTNGHGHPAAEPDPDEQLNVIIAHISSETTGAMHKEGITELHHFLKAYPHKRARVDKMLESTGTAFRKYITRALASRAAEDEERNVAVANTLSKLESNGRDRTLSSSSYSPNPESSRAHTPQTPTSPASVRPDTTRSPPRSSLSDLPDPQLEKLSRLHNIFQYRSSIASNGSSHGRSTPSELTRPSG
ncbi:ARM repeat-containing protein [Obba rivulosa]|uniref:ARM repeat-containing protein n=1 Tax=Obba rivulosa TaxID=1052685 RepID=A0A8E2DTQ6_9APHY|nr:ARM repeat-containing protein [Obba rivulosa]